MEEAGEEEVVAEEEVICEEVTEEECKVHNDYCYKWLLFGVIRQMIIVSITYYGVIIPWKYILIIVFVKLYYFDKLF